MRSDRLLLVLPLGAALLVSAQHAKRVPITQFSDPESGVRFEYPAVWKRVDVKQSFLGSEILQNGEAPRIAVGFSPDGNLYAKTVLVGLRFVFATPTVTSEDMCLDRVRKFSPYVESDTETINGVVYQHASGGDAATCHDREFDIYATYRGDRCYLFEENFDTRCWGAGDGARKLTDAQQAVLAEHLDAIMQSVHIESAASLGANSDHADASSSPRP